MSTTITAEAVAEYNEAYDDSITVEAANQLVVENIRSAAEAVLETAIDNFRSYYSNTCEYNENDCLIDDEQFAKEVVKLLDTIRL